MAESGLRDLGRELKAFAAPHGVRVVLLRRPAGVPSLGRRSFLVFSGLHDRWALRLEPSSPSDLLGIDLAPIASGERPLEGEEHEDPIYLVCTHANHDACCGRLGPPIARHLAALRPDETWECSHIGGDRFAANLVGLPYGLYFGRVADPGKTAALYEAGRIDLDHYRGRSCYEPVVQAADVMLRMREGLDGIDDLVPEERTDHGGGESTLAFLTSEGERVSIRLRTERADKRRLTCAATNPGRPRSFVAID